jgi:hypothetical protein
VVALGYSLCSRALVSPIRAMMDFSRRSPAALSERLGTTAPGKLASCATI